jgi:hypothetical protein
VSEVEGLIEGRIEASGLREVGQGGYASENKRLCCCWSRRGTCLRLLLGLPGSNYHRSIGRLCLGSLTLTSSSAVLAASTPSSVVASLLLLLEGGLLRTALNSADLSCLLRTGGIFAIPLFPREDDLPADLGEVHAINIVGLTKLLGD